MHHRITFPLANLSQPYCPPCGNLNIAHGEETDNNSSSNNNSNSSDDDHRISLSLDSICRDDVTEKIFFIEVNYTLNSISGQALCTYESAASKNPDKEVREVVKKSKKNYKIH